MSATVLDAAPPAAAPRALSPQRLARLTGVLYLLVDGYGGAAAVVALTPP
jgi:hypothetical protein